MIRLLLKRKSEVIREYYISGGELKVGRDPGNDIVLDDRQVSARHCVLRFGRKGNQVEDLNTSFGTRIRGRRITKEPLEPGSEVEVGSYILEVVGEGDKDSAYLLGVQGRMDGRKFKLKSPETRIGRSEEFNDIWIPKESDRSVSRRHATIYHDGKSYRLTDKRSRNRTFVNQRQVNESDEVNLKNNDEILIGKSIFRFVKGDTENYSYPGKAGIFWTRMLPRFRALGVLLLLIAGAYLVYMGVGGLSVIYSRPDSYDLSQSPWRPEGLRRRAGGYLGDGALDITPSPVIGDITGTGTNEVVISAPGGQLYAWTSEGGLLWQNRLGQESLTSPQLADMNGNGVMDVVVGSDDSRVYVLDGRTGHLIYRSTFLGGKVLFASSPLVTDLDGNGHRDIVALTDDRVISFIYSPIVGEREPYYFRTAEDIMSSPVLFSSGGEELVAVPTNGGKVYLFEATNPENRRVIDLTQQMNMHGGLNLILNELNTAPGVADLTGDGSEELVCAAGSYFMAAVSERGPSLSWLYRIEPFSRLEPPLRYGSPVISDFSGNGLADVALGWANGRVMVLDGRSGGEIWSYEAGGGGSRIIASLALGDFNRDGLADPVVITEDGEVLILDGGGGSVISRFSLNERVTSSPAVADLTGDGYLDIAVVTAEGRLRLLSSPVRSFRGEVIWSGLRNGTHNRGSFFYDDRSDFYYRLLIAGGVLGAGSLLFGFMVKVKRKKKRPQKVKV